MTDRHDTGEPSGLGRLTAVLLMAVIVASFETTAAQTFAGAALDDIGGRTFYPLVFGAFIVAELIALTLGAWQADRVGPAQAFVTGAITHAIGLLVCATAPFFGWLLAGRIIQGVGSGIVWVAAYVLIGQCFPEQRRSRTLGYLAMGWSIPALMGPVVAGALTQSAGWRWVLLPVPAIEAAALIVAWPVLRRIMNGAVAPQSNWPWRRRLIPAALLAFGVVVILGVRDLPAAAAWPALAVAVTLVLLSARVLFPTGALRLAHGTPAAVLLRGMVGGPWQGVAFLLPLTLIESRGYGLTTAGLSLSCGIVGFAFGGLLCSRPRVAAIDRSRVVLFGQLVQAIGLALTATGLISTLPPALLYIGWGVTGFGASLAITALNATVLNLAEPAHQSEASAAMAMAEAVTVSIIAAVAGLALAGVDSHGPGVAPIAQGVIFGCAALLVLLTPAVSRLTPKPVVAVAN